MFVVRFKNEFCVEVSKKKILQGLYQFPMSKFVESLPNDGSKKIIDRIIYLWKINNELEEYSKIVSTINHDFTHFHLKLDIVEIVLKKKKKLSDYLWMNKNEFEKKPISSLVRKAKKKIL